MNPGIQQLIETLREQHGVLETITQSLSLEELQDSSSEQSWSLLEVMEHLYMVEKATQGAVRKSIGQLPALRQLSFAQRCRAVLLRFALKLPLKFKVPVKTVVPSGLLSPEELQKSWEELEQGWLELLEPLRGDTLELGVFSHPLSGWMNAEQSLRFLSEHFKHHLPQVRRILNEVGRSDMLAAI